MDTGATGNRRFSRIGSTPPVGRIAGGRTTEIAPTEAVSAPGSSTESDSRSPDRDHEHDRRRRTQERYALAAEVHQALFAAADAEGGPAAWRIPGPVIAELYREVRAAAARSGPASHVARASRSATPGLAGEAVSRAYCGHEQASGEGRIVRRTV